MVVGVGGGSGSSGGIYNGNCSEGRGSVCDYEDSGGDGGGSDGGSSGRVCNSM